jgi:peptidoglycan/LPS O-acetylase OafA/YrhL
MKISFNRITTSGNFIPEIDGLRFMAIFSVVCFHLIIFLTNKFPLIFNSNLYVKYIQHLFLHGHIGVPLFFVISGFILAVPFINAYLIKKNTFSIKDFYIRRITRLEPPYILVLTILLFFGVYNTVDMTVWDRIYSYFSSIFYFHNFIVNDVPFLNGVTWSLEIEIQFYVLTPLILMIFKISSNFKRRLIIILSIIFFLLLNIFIEFKYLNLLMYLQFFLVGILLADLYYTNQIIFKKTKYDSLITILFLFFIFLYDEADWSKHLFLYNLCSLCIIFLFYYYVLIHRSMKLFSNKIITNIGGMCYSIYLLHYPIINFFGSQFIKHNIFNNIIILSLSLIILVLLISSIFFILIERPCMNKNWLKNLRIYLQTTSK